MGVETEWEKSMGEKAETPGLGALGHGEIDALILRALVRKLIARGVLSPDDVRAVLFDAATHLDLVGSDLTAETASTIVEEDLAPAFLGS
jgi:hypothetical protein